MVPQLWHVHTRSERLKVRLMTPQVHSLLDGSNRPILITVLPHQRALYSNCRTNSDHPASEIDRASRRFFTIPSTDKSSSATAWFSRISHVDNLWRKSLRWFEIRSCASATRIRCFSRFFDPFALRERRRCSFANLSNDDLRYRGFSTFSPALVVAKCVKPRSIPRISLYGFVAGRSFPVSTNTDTKCFPDGSRDTVTVLTYPLNGREHAKRMGENFGNFIDLCFLINIPPLSTLVRLSASL